MSQSGLSRAIAQLELRVGTRLVIRHSGMPVRVTPQGELLVFHGRRLLGEQDLAFRRVRENIATIAPT